MPNPAKQEAIRKAYCQGCDEEITNGYESVNHDKLCKECDDAYDNQTGYCSLSCCLGGGCDQSC